MPINTPNIKGLSTIIWGTVGALGSPAGAIVVSLDITPENPGGVGKIEDGNGATVADVLLDDGFDAKIECEYDSAKTWPVIGTAATLTLPTAQGAGGTTQYACYVTAPNAIKMARKKEAMIELSLRYRPGITP
jgi:hypothetical protein